MKAAVQAPPAHAGIALANWNWKVVRQFIAGRTGRRLSRSACLRYLHRPANLEDVFLKLTGRDLRD